MRILASVTPLVSSAFLSGPDNTAIFARMKMEDPFGVFAGVVMKAAKVEKLQSPSF